MNVSLTAELEDLVNQKIASGLYHSASEVVCEALRLMQEQDELKRLRLEGLCAEIQKGLQAKKHDGREDMATLKTKYAKHDQE